ncbi:MAG TPA: DUF4349 domain-containing protein [Acidimicrobiales bacterium]|nr:DUF4349 domain-containing protein [Acidimicrobiales bacterium]
MLDDDRLAALLASAGAAFEVPASGADDILARAAGSAEERPGKAPDDPEHARPGRVRRAAALAGRHRVLTAAACLVILAVAGAFGALAAGPARQSVTSSLPRSPVVVHPRGLTTTTRPGSAPAPGAGGTAASPSASSPASGTQPKEAQGVNGSTASAGSGTATTVPALPSGSVGQSAKIEQTGALALTVGRGQLERTMTQLTAVASAHGGFVAASQTQSGSGSGGAPYGTITLQVPVDDFGSVLAQAQELGKTSSLTTKATDVTGQYVNLQARIAALQTSEQQYLTIMAKATTVGDVLAVQEQLDAIESQIEQLQGQLQVLTSETSYSTLTVTVSEATPPPRPIPLPESGLVRAWHDSVAGFVGGVEGLIRLAGPVLFALLCLGVVVLGGRALWRRSQRHRL